jgi:hypothetical protein
MDQQPMAVILNTGGNINLQAFSCRSALNITE